MKKIIVFSILLLSAIAVTVGTTITTTIQIQPAYAQAQHCMKDPPNGERTECVTSGKDPSLRFCVKSACTDIPTTHQEAGQTIGSQRQNCAQGIAECTVNKP
jgi:hypothetical protein